LKRAGTELWNELVAEHGEPATLKAVTGSGGFHLYFSRSRTVGLNRRNNFAGLRVDGTPFGIDGRGVGGLLFAPPSRYTGNQGEKKTYSWAPGGNGVPQPMPAWLVDIINACSSGASSPVAAELSNGLSTPPPFASADASAPSSFSASGDERAERVGEASVPAHLELLVRELKVMLKEKANDSTSAYASALPHGLHGTYYCFRTQGPRKCFFGREHSGSNNFNFLKRGRNVFYRCHGDQCSHEPARKLGKLTLEASLQDATMAPVDQYDDMEVITRHTRGSLGTQNLLLQMVVAHAGRDAYANLGRLFAYLYLIEGRILTTVHEAEKSRKGAVFYVWDGSSWIQDTFNLVSNVFISQMGHLLVWYELKRDAYLSKVKSEHPDLQPFWNQETHELDVRTATGKQIALIKRASQSCKDKLKPDMPSFGQLNVQDPTHATKCFAFHDNGTVRHPTH
jgi:hypothetical protein